MKKIALALAAVLALPAGASAEQMLKDRHEPAAHAYVHRPVKLDCGATGLFARQSPAMDKNSTGARKGPRLGIDIYPWFLPNLY